MDPGRYKLSSYGMPSDHAQATSFIVTYLCLFVLLRLYRNASLLEDLWKYILCCCLVGIGGGVAFSSTIPNVLYFEYVHIKKESTHRQRRKGSC
uniref:AcidPPc domain-containing protein n=1 Tax=Macrostomum lignano TaxID=282301 RepID=A0A1I8GDN6_9PLAT